MATVLHAALLAQNAGCPCISSSSHHTSSGVTFTLAGESYTYPATYGLSTCAAHDQNQPPYCSISGAPEWCTDYWCYVDANNCDQAYSSAVYLEGLSYSYFTCGNGNTFDAWFGSESSSGTSNHSLTDLVSLLHGYTESISNALEENHAEAQSATGCSPASSCDCVACVLPSSAWTAVAPKTTPNMSLATTTYKQRPGSSITSNDATTDQCLAGILTSSFTRIAATESDANRIGYEYYGSQALGNYIQWPGMQDCSEYDPRYRPWYAAAASGPKDVVIVIDTSGSMSGTREAMARSAASMVVDTLTEVDYVTVVRFSSSASSYSTTLVQATDATKTAIKSWITTNIDATGSTNFEAAFTTMWSVLDATTTSSGCNRVVLFLSDGEPNEWSDAIASNLQTKAASYRPQVHILTYALGNGASATTLKQMACENDGVFYAVADDGPLADTMASYFQVLAPMLSPCRMRWIRYEDYYTGTELLGACLASFEKESATSATSCNGGLSGLGETGDARVPKLIGVGCVDMNLVVDLPTLEAHPEYSAFWSLVQSEMSACPRLTLTEDQMETIRANTGSDSVCDAARVSMSPPPPPSAPGGGDGATGAIVGAIIGVLLVGGIGVGAFCLCKSKGRKSQPPSGSHAQPQPVVQMQAQPGYPAQPGYSSQVPVVQGTCAGTHVPMGQPVQGYPGGY